MKIKFIAAGGYRSFWRTRQIVIACLKKKIMGWTFGEIPMIDFN